MGGESFRRELLLRMEGKLGEHHSGGLHRASAEAKAERIIAEELARQGWQESDLVARRKSDTVKAGDCGAAASRNNPLDQSDCGPDALG